MTIKKAIGDAQKSQRLHTRSNTIDSIYIKISILILCPTVYIQMKMQNIQAQCDKSPREGALPHLAQTVRSHYQNRIKGFQDFKS